MKSTHPFVSLDIETTGTDVNYDSIIEIGMVKFDPSNFTILESFQSFVYNSIPIPKSITLLTGITQEHLLQAPKIETLTDTILSFVNNCILIGHNIEYDLAFLKKESITFENIPIIDTFHLANILLYQEPSLNLEYLCKKYNLIHFQAHRALEDAKACKSLFEFLVQKIGTLNFFKKTIIHYFLGNLSSHPTCTYYQQLFDYTKPIPYDTVKKIIDFWNRKKIRTAKKKLFLLRKNYVFFSCKKNIPVKTWISKVNESIYLFKKTLSLPLIQELSTTFHREKHCHISIEYSLYLEEIMIACALLGIQKQICMVAGHPFIEHKIEKICNALTKIFPLHFALIDTSDNYISFTQLQTRIQETTLQTLSFGEIFFLIKIILWTEETTDGNFKELKLYGKEQVYKANICGRGSIAKQFHILEEPFFRKQIEMILSNILITSQTSFLKLMLEKDAPTYCMNNTKIVVIGNYLLDISKTKYLGNVSYSHIPPTVFGDISHASFLALACITYASIITKRSIRILQNHQYSTYYTFVRISRALWEKIFLPKIRPYLQAFTITYEKYRAIQTENSENGLSHEMLQHLFIIGKICGKHTHHSYEIVIAIKKDTCIIHLLPFSLKDQIQQMIHPHSLLYINNLFPKETIYSYFKKICFPLPPFSQKTFIPLLKQKKHTFIVSQSEIEDLYTKTMQNSKAKVLMVTASFLEGKELFLKHPWNKPNDIPLYAYKISGSNQKILSFLKKERTYLCIVPFYFLFQHYEVLEYSSHLIFYSFPVYTKHQYFLDEQWKNFPHVALQWKHILGHVYSSPSLKQIFFCVKKASSQESHNNLQELLSYLHSVSSVSFY